MIIGLGIILSVLFYTSRDPFAYVIVFIIYNIISMYTGNYTINEIHKAIVGSKNRIEQEKNVQDFHGVLNEYLKGINVLEEYYIIKPQIKRSIIVLIFSFIVLIFSIHWKITKLMISGLISYIMIIMIIIISEIIIGKWRMERDNKLRSIESEINELKRRTN